MSDSWPSVSVVMPVRDEADDLADAVAAILAQEYPGALEVVIAVAPSGDGTDTVAKTLAADDERVTVVENPKGLTSAGLNVAIAASSGEVIVRVDGHARLTPGYIRRAVELLDETGADNVGGIQEAVGTTTFERAVAAAMSSRFGTGDARFHYGGKPGPVDTVYLGVFRREAIKRVGGFDETLVRNQDYEMNWRIRQAGGTVYFHPDLRVRYRPRGSLRGLAHQYFEYGRWKREMLRRHPRSVRLRQLVPPAAVLGVVAGVVVGISWTPWGFVVPSAYLAADFAASAFTGGEVTAPARLRLPVVFAVMHLCWGTGFLVGGRLDRVRPPTLDD